MRRLLNSNGILGVIAALLLVAPAGFAARPQSQTQAKQQPVAADQGQASQTQSQQQPTADQAQTPQAPDQPASDEEQTPKGVKAGSEKDINSIGNRGVGKGINLYSIEKEIAVGKQFAQEVERTSKLINDPVVTEYVNRIGQNLVRNSDAKVPFTIKVIDSDEINAMALPGGFFYVNSGLILRADEEAEMAGVMGHEIGHVAARHWGRNQTKGEIAQWATIPLILLGPGGWAGYGIYEGLNVAMPLSFLKFSRDQEREADYLGLQYMYKAGYDPNAFVSFFEKVEAEERRRPGSIPKIFSTHPPTPDRVQKAQEEISTILPVRSEYIVTTSEFDTVKARLRRIENKSKLDDKKSTSEKPTLRTRTETQQQDKTNKQDTTQQSGDDSDPDRPVLKKRPDDNGTN
jgi:beta-barrel assembly-enhancing protease